MKRLITLLALVCVLSTQAQKVTFEKVLPVNDGFSVTVHTGMDKYNKNPNGGLFWQNNVIRKPLYESSDSIIYNIKFITHYNGLLLWGGKACFTNTGDSIKCLISDLMQLKKSSMSDGVNYINVKVDEMEGTKGDQLNLHRLSDAINKFYKKFE